jgi:hypothetical protein
MHALYHPLICISEEVRDKVVTLPVEPVAAFCLASSEPDLHYLTAILSQ